MCGICRTVSLVDLIIDASFLIRNGVFRDMMCIARTMILDISVLIEWGDDLEAGDANGDVGVALGAVEWMINEVLGVIRGINGPRYASR